MVDLLRLDDRIHHTYACFSIPFPTRSAFPAISCSFPAIGVFSIVEVPILTGFSTTKHGSDGVATKMVFQWRDGFQVFRFYAFHVETEMVNNETFWNGADKMFIGPPMSKRPLFLPALPVNPVTFLPVRTTSPDEAAVLSAFGLIPERLNLSTVRILVHSGLQYTTCARRCSSQSLKPNSLLRVSHQASSLTWAICQPSHIASPQSHGLTSRPCCLSHSTVTPDLSA